MSGAEAKRDEPREVGEITLEMADCSGYVLVHSSGRDLLVQSDLDFVGIAETFGWSTRRVKRRAKDGSGRCRHTHTDGTVDRKGCGATAAQFVSAASAYLDEHIGDSVPDPGYFDEESDE